MISSYLRKSLLILTKPPVCYPHSSAFAHIYGLPNPQEVLLIFEKVPGPYEERPKNNIILVKHLKVLFSMPDFYN